MAPARDPNGMGTWRNSVVIQRGTMDSVILNWPDCPELSAMPSATIVQVSCIPARNLTTDSIEKAFATIEWGGIGHKIEVDVAGGFSIPVTGAVLVKVSYPLDSGSQSGEITQPDILVRVSVGNDGGGTDVGKLTRTMLVALQLSGNTLSALQEIPAWAQSVSITGTSVAAPGLEVRQYTGNATAAIINSDNTSKAGATGIATGARYFAVFNPGVAAVSELRAVFHLNDENSGGNTVVLGVARAPAAISAGVVLPLPLNPADGSVMVSRSTGGGVSAYAWAETTARAASGVITATAGKTLFLFFGFYDTAGAAYLQVYDSAAVPADGATPIINIPIQGAGANYSLDISQVGRLFATGISWAVSSTADTKTLIGAALAWNNSAFA